MNEDKIKKAVKDAVSAVDSLKDCNDAEKREVVRRIFGAAAVDEMLRLIELLQTNYRN